MKTAALFLLYCFCFFVLASSSLLAQSSADGIDLSYRFPSDKPVHYVNTGKVVQDMDVNGQSMQVNVLSYLGCSIKSSGAQDNNLKLEISVDSLGETVDSPQGMSGGAIRDAAGMMINIVISPKGRELDITEARNAVINIEGSGATDLSDSFVGFFPRLPDEPVKQGYTWSTTDTIDNKTKLNSTFLIVTAQNTFEGMEKINGADCVKITSNLQGTRLMNIQTQGVELKTSGPFTGKSEMYFSPADGYFLKYSVTTTMKGEIEMISPQSMTIPVIMDMTSVNEVKR